MSFINEDFLLHGETARGLYNDYAKDHPIIDYHCHLPPAEIAENRQFRNLFEIWLEGDHYKWRAMRADGVPERYCTGDASDYEKFLAWARTVPHTLRNPLYHWNHLELMRYFGIDLLISEDTADEIWERANEQLQRPELRPHGIFEKFKVQVVCTTDDPTDDLSYHRQLADSNLSTRIYPAFRPDKALLVDNPEVFNPWVDRLAEVSGLDCTTFTSFLNALEARHDFFHEMGGRLSDHGLEHCFAAFCSAAEASGIFDRARTGRSADPHEKESFATYLMVFLGELDAGKGWTKQLHLGTLRNNNSRRFQEVGPDTGFDSMGDFSQAQALSRYLDRLESKAKLPKMIFYNNNPVDNMMLATMAGNFQDGSVPGKIQFGAPWWYLDQKHALEQHFNDLSNVGLLSRFVGMLTDSRSFLSYPRHEYFRRVLCNLLGQDIDNGELPRDMNLIGEMIGNICYHNAAAYFGFDLEAGATSAAPL